jgi:hypothetical protein
MPEIQKTKEQESQIGNPFEEMIKRLDVAAKIMKLDKEVYEIVKKPSRMVYCSNSTGTFERRHPLFA